MHADAGTGRRVISEAEQRSNPQLDHTQRSRENVGGSVQICSAVSDIEQEDSLGFRNPEQGCFLLEIRAIVTETILVGTQQPNFGSFGKTQNDRLRAE